MQIFTELDFKIMPWKNGGGVTTELFCLNDPTHSSVLFRLSIARVEYDGPFSNFLGIDRTLLLLKGKGFNLESINSNTVIEFNSAPFNFKGEDSVKCTLIDGPCVDFNVMTARSFAHSKVFVENLSKNSPFFFKAECDFKFIYDNETQELYKLEMGDELMMEGKNKNLIIVDVTKL